MPKAWGSEGSSSPFPVCPSRQRVTLCPGVFCSQTKAEAWTQCSKAQIGGDDKNHQKENAEPHLPRPSVPSEAEPVPEHHFLLL